MKKTILIVVAVLVALQSAAGFARAETGPVTLLISGGPGNSGLHISLTPDGREYLIVSTDPLEVGGDVCEHPAEDLLNELLCKATAIAGFEVNAGAGADSVYFSSDIPVPVTVRGGAGADRLIGGNASDKLIGGPDRDFLEGRRGDDWLLGGPGTDKLLGGPGNDQLRGGPDKDTLVGGPGKNELFP
jgi:Ca2+-binding RTX toxin-like protein